MRILTTALLLFVVVGLSGSGCASAENEAMSGIGLGTPDASVDARPPATGSCSPQYCPTPTNASGVGCCLTPNGPCGFDYGMGCVPSPTRDGG